MHCRPYGEMAIGYAGTAGCEPILLWISWMRPVFHFQTTAVVSRMTTFQIMDSFIHSFILTISIAPLQVLYYSGALPTTARILYWSFTPKRTCRQLQVKDLPKVPTWRLERESNPRPSGWKSSTQPMRHRVQQIIMYGRYFGLQALIPVITGILPHSLPEWAFRARPAFCGFPLP